MQWSVAIFSSRETLQTLASSIDAILAATKEVPATIDLIVNGDRGVANDVARYTETLHPAERARTVLRVWFVSVADKAHAWNQYIHEIMPPSDLGFFVDGYARVMPDALKLISDGLGATPQALAGSGVPTIGRSSRKQTELMLRGGGIHGNLYAVRGGFLALLRTSGFRLPLGLYRTDGVLGAVIFFALDPAINDWDPSRILVHSGATWTIRPVSWRNPADIRTHFRRIARQAQGVLENLAVREHLAIQKKSPQSLPRTSADLVWSWITTFPRAAFGTFVRNPLCLLAAQKLRCPRDWSAALVSPLLINQSTFE